MATRRGRRVGTRTVVLHVASSGDGSGSGGSGASDAGNREPRVGFVVGKAVGNAVGRNKVKRRLRHLVRERLEALPAGGIVVVRALPASADAGYGDLARDLDTALRRLRGSDASGVER
jgi:ribonuclease P protein component